MHINHRYRNLASMFYSKTTKTTKINTRRKYIGSSLADVILYFLIVITIGNSFGIRNSFAQQELRTQQPSTISESPWSNNLPTNFDGKFKGRLSAVIPTHVGRVAVAVHQKMHQFPQSTIAG